MTPAFDLPLWKAFPVQATTLITLQRNAIIFLCIIKKYKYYLFILFYNKLYLKGSIWQVLTFLNKKKSQRDSYYYKNGDDKYWIE
jgi:hypothetical protein